MIKTASMTVITLFLLPGSSLVLRLVLRSICVEQRFHCYCWNHIKYNARETKVLHLDSTNSVHVCARVVIYSNYMNNENQVRPAAQNAKKCQRSQKRLAVNSNIRTAA